jgi:hypothetical protein
MRIIGGLIVFLSFSSLSNAFTLNSFMWLLVGSALVLLPEILKLLILKGK